MSLLKQRGGNVHIRVGGNTQETATLVDSLPDGKILEKAGINTAITVRPSLLRRNHRLTQSCRHKPPRCYSPLTWFT